MKVIIQHKEDVETFKKVKSHNIGGGFVIFEFFNDTTLFINVEKNDRMSVYKEDEK